jgi:carboxylesterase
LTNCPRQFLELGDAIHTTGANVLILRVPRHGIADESGRAIGGVGNVGGLTAAELSAYADDAVDIASGLGRDVRVLGLSMGGVIATWIAQNRPDAERVVAVAPALTLPRVPDFVDEFPKRLGLPHDVIDVQQPDANPEVVYPVLLGLLGFGG